MKGSLDLLSQANPYIKHTVIQLTDGSLGLPIQANLLIKHRQPSNRWVPWTYLAKPHFASWHTVNQLIKHNHTQLSDMNKTFLGNQNEMAKGKTTLHEQIHFQEMSLGFLDVKTTSSSP